MADRGRDLAGFEGSYRAVQDAGGGHAPIGPQVLLQVGAVQVQQVAEGAQVYERVVQHLLEVGLLGKRSSLQAEQISLPSSCF